MLSEKPVTPTVYEALLLAGLSEATGVLLATSQSRRHSPGIRAFRDALRSLGGAGQLDVQFFQNPRFGGFRDEMEHPLLIDMAIHQFDQARYILGADPVSVYCEEFNPPWSWYRGDAAAQAIFRFDDGTRFSYTGSWCADGLTTSWNGSWRGSAPDGAASWDGETGVVAQAREADPQPRFRSRPATKGWMPRSPSSSPRSTAARRRPARSIGTCGAWRWSRRPWSPRGVGAPVAFADVFAAAHEAAMRRRRRGCRRRTAAHLSDGGLTQFPGGVVPLDELHTLLRHGAQCTTAARSGRDESTSTPTRRRSAPETTGRVSRSLPARLSPGSRREAARGDRGTSGPMTLSR